MGRQRLMYQITEPLEKVEDSNVYQGDSLEVMKLLPSNCCHLAFTSPPYAGKFRAYSQKGDPRDLGQLDVDEYVDAFVPYVKEIERLLKHEDGGVFILNIGEKYYDGFASLYPEKLLLKIIEETQFNLIDKVPWIKLDPMPNKKTRVGTLGWEHIYVFGTQTKDINRNWEYMKSPYKTTTSSISLRRDYKRMRKQTNHPMNDAKCFDDIGANPRNYIMAHNEPSSREEYDYLEQHYCISATQSIRGSNHEAQMPHHVAEFFIGGYSQEGQTVLDPFGGSGTTAAVSWRLNRNYIHIDLMKKNCEYTEKRVNAIPRRKSLFNFYGLSESDKSKLSQVQEQTKSKGLF